MERKIKTIDFDKISHQDYKIYLNNISHQNLLDNLEKTDFPEEFINITINSTNSGDGEMMQIFADKEIAEAIKKSIKNKIKPVEIFYIYEDEV